MVLYYILFASRPAEQCTHDQCITDAIDRLLQTLPQPQVHMEIQSFCYGAGGSNQWTASAVMSAPCAPLKSVCPSAAVPLNVSVIG